MPDLNMLMLMLIFGPTIHDNLQLFVDMVGGELDLVEGELDLVGGELDLVGGELDLVGGELDLVGGELDQVQSKWGRTRWERTRHGAKPVDTLIPHSRSFFTEIPHPALFSSKSRIPFSSPEKYIKKPNFYFSF